MYHRRPEATTNKPLCSFELINAPIISMNTPQLTKFYSKFNRVIQIPHLVSPGKNVKLKPESDRITGIDYIPPLNARATIVAPIRGTSQTKLILASAGLQSATQLPDSFSWANSSDVVKYGKAPQNIAAMLMSTVRNQQSCGSCWAVSSATVLGDRFAIFGQMANPELSPTSLMACCQGDQAKGCQGGFPAAAGSCMSDRGITTETCQPYTWCQGACSSGSEGDYDRDIPDCESYFDSCYTCASEGECKKAGGSAPQRFKVQGGTTQAITNIEGIKAEIFANGPVVGAYGVYADFVLGGKNANKAENWKETKNVYINRSKSDSPYGSNDNAKQLMGFHAVVLVGWSHIDIPGFGDTPYWIVRNSWGPKWNGDGYFFVAFSNEEKDINTAVGMDVPHGFDIGGGQTQMMGGATTFTPDIVRKNAPPPGPSPQPQPTPTPNPPPDVNPGGCPPCPRCPECPICMPGTIPMLSQPKDGSKTWRVVLILIILVLIACWVGWTMARR